jgi:hypothetical protein
MLVSEIYSMIAGVDIVYVIGSILKLITIQLELPILLQSSAPIYIPSTST